MGLFSGVRSLWTRNFRGAQPGWQQEGASSCNHVIQFYAGAFPAKDIADFIQAGLALGEAAVVVATPKHIKALRQRLADDAAVTYLDAAETLERFMVHGRPDAIRFQDSVGRVAKAAAAQGNGRVRAFGEMVVMLCEQGEPEAAAQLEALWNDLGTRQSLTLLCSYPVDSVSGRNRMHLARLRDSHTHYVA